MQVKKIEIPYKSQRLVIDGSNISALREMTNSREVVQNQVNKLYNQLMEGVHFQTPLAVSQRPDGKMTVIDGNHRRLAILKWISEDKTRKIEIELAIYENLSPTEEIEVYRWWNSGRKQNSNDVIAINRKYISVLRELEGKVTIYPLNSKSRKEGFHFTPLAKAWLMATQEFPRFLPYQNSAMEFLDAVKSFGEYDAIEMKRFMNFFTEAFGKPGFDNPYQTSTMLNVLVTIWHDNDKVMAGSEMSKNFCKRVFGKSAILLAGRNGGRSATKQLYMLVANELTQGKKARDCMRFREVSLLDRNDADA